MILIIKLLKVFLISSFHYKLLSLWKYKKQYLTLIYLLNGVAHPNRYNSIIYFFLKLSFTDLNLRIMVISVLCHVFINIFCLFIMSVRFIYKSTYPYLERCYNAGLYNANISRIICLYSLFKLYKEIILLVFAKLLPF